ncbi:hypothetical protein Gotur_025960 [Gossypium turneri]
MEMQQTSKNAESGMCFSLNTDGAVNFVFGFSAAGILDGLLLLQKQGYDEVAIQSDNLEVVIAISDTKEEKWSLRYVPREAIKIVDALEKMALSNDEVLHMFYDLPLEIEEVL